MRSSHRSQSTASKDSRVIRTNRTHNTTSLSAAAMYVVKIKHGETLRRIVLDECFSYDAL